MHLDRKAAFELLSMKDCSKFVGSIVKLKVDRPIGTSHPEFGWVYPVNYGYVPGTLSGDGEELDGYVLGVSYPVEYFEGRCIAVIRRISDDDDKLVLVPDGVNASDEEIRARVDFQEKYFESVILRG